ncbi:RRP6 [Candida pseudojiufengensis]|uniref:RRP6 n=1 Tax=Candida pseudojiufengensis TaxID=497109 RepID=UPI00222442B2|nr:RRP6 [Candida pseudojiufengensis]KAI5966291.1 RRP6 [Candida pseudojiufengensis]
MSINDLDALKNILSKLVPTIRAASALAAQDVNFYKSVDSNLGEEIDQGADRLLSISNDLLRATSSNSNDVEQIKFGKENITSEASWKPVGNIIDSIFEKIDFTFDQLNKSLNKNHEETKQYLEDGGNDSVSKELNHIISKPQLKFKVPVDNSEENPFKPKLSSKPHALQSWDTVSKIVNPKPVFEESIELIDPPYYAHPYEYEIDNQPYPNEVLQKSEPIPPKDWSSTEAIWVGTIEELNKMIDELLQSQAIAVDLEHHDYRSYYGIVCLMQISNREKDWIIDTIALRDDLTRLNEVFANPAIIKVFHGAFMDIIWLQRDLGLYVVSLFDTYHASRQLGFSKFSLQYLLDTFAHFRTSKKYQLADWRIRPLPKAMMAYARSDTHFLLYIFDQLRNKLIDADKLKQVLYDSRQVAKRRFEYTKFRPFSNKFTNNVSCPIMASNPKEPWGSIMYQYNVPFFKKPIVEVLYNWRDVVARQKDESVRFIMPNQLLVTLATIEGPVDVNKILNAPAYVSEAVRLNAKEIAKLINQTLKESEQNDWAIVDKYNNQVSDQTKTHLIDIDLVNDAFEYLLNDANTSIGDKTLMKVNSAILQHGTLQPQVWTYEYNGDHVKQHDFGSVSQERSVKAWEKLCSLRQTTIIPEEVLDLEVDTEDQEIEPEVDAASLAQIEEDKIKPKTGQQVLFSKDRDINPDELITLRKNNKNRHKKELETGDESTIDYANADKILIEPSRKQDKKKKRSFDPNAKEGDGPRAAKRKKNNTAGRTSTFKLKYGKGSKR